MVERPAAGSIFWVFLLLGFMIDVGFGSLVIALRLVGTDLLHTNIHRSHANAWMMIALSPFYSLLLTLGLFSLARLVGAIGAKLGSLYSGQVPLWVLVILVPVCGLVTATQGVFVENDPSLLTWNLAFLLSSNQVLPLAGCWLWTHESRRWSQPARIDLTDC